MNPNNLKHCASVVLSNGDLSFVSRLSISSKNCVWGQHSIHFMSQPITSFKMKYGNQDSSDNESVRLCSSLFNSLLHEGGNESQIMVLTWNQSQAKSFRYVMLEKFGQEVWVTTVDEFNGFPKRTSIVILLLKDSSCEEEEGNEIDTERKMGPILSWLNQQNKNANSSADVNFPGLVVIGNPSQLLSSGSTKSVWEFFHETTLSGSNLNLVCTSNEIKTEQPVFSIQNSGSKKTQSVCSHGNRNAIRNISGFGSGSNDLSSSPLCQRFVTRKLPCGHFKLFRCHQSIEGARCKKMVMIYRQLRCGHQVKEQVRCSNQHKKATTKSKQKCHSDCELKLGCDHPCQFKCEGSDVSTTNHEEKHPCTTDTVSQFCHGRCKEGHICGKQHAGDEFCPPCDYVCTKFRPGCEHKVEFSCSLDGEAVDHLLEEPCTDFTCSKLCKREHACETGSHPCGQSCPPCNFEMLVTFPNCDHEMLLPCHEFDASYAKYCGSNCQRPRPEGCPHPCPIPCHDHTRFPGQQCPPCEELVMKARDCGHEAMTQCKTSDFFFDTCEEMVDIKDSSPCGHSILVLCCLAEGIIKAGNANLHCKSPCDFYFDPEIGGCGHHCEGKCSSCAENRFHERCARTCEKQHVLCGHKCNEFCSSTCSPCEQDCQNSCDHQNCDRICSQPCKPCNMPCKYSCLHGKCRKKCSEVCDKKPCTKFCRKLSSNCGHPCIGYCGETCPPLCGICDQKQLLMQDVLGKTCIKATDRFILLEDCKHTIDAETLDALMNADTVDGEITPKKCPLLSCRMVINKCDRFKPILLRVQKDIELVKKKVYGNPEEIQKIQEDAMKDVLVAGREKLQIQLSALGKLRYQILDDLVESNYLGYSYGNFLEMSIGKAQGLAYIAKQYQMCVRILEKMRQDLSVELYSNLELSVRNLMECKFIRHSYYPLTPFELRSIALEWERIQILSKLYCQKGRGQTEVFKTLLRQPSGKASFDNAVLIASRIGVYNEETREELKKATKDWEGALECKLVISNAQKRSIVHSIAMSSGRWFKCENGHPCIVLENNRPTEVPTCGECGVRINQLASSMNGIDQPLPCFLTA